MKHVTRRTFCTGLASTLGGLSLTRTTGLSARQRRRVRKGQDQLRIQAIKPVTFYAPYRDYNGQTLFRYHGQNIQARTVYRVTTNLGITGYGECWGKNSLTANDLKAYLGTSPFDWIAQRSNLTINMALYDLMGKYLELPAWKLIGPQVRNKIPVSFWTVSQTPSAMATEVRQASRMGYRWLKYHTDEVQNVIEQTRAMQAVAPQGFQVHYDLNANALLDDILPLLKQLETFPVAGRFEDPIVATDRKGWKTLRREIKRPILGHHVPLDFIRSGLVDGYMASHAAIGNAMRVAALAEDIQMPMMVQQCGGTVNQAFLAHLASVFPMATIDHVNLAHLWREEITDQLMPVVDGHVQVPDGPGLGIPVNEKKLADMARQPAPAYQPFLVRIRYQDGPTIYSRHNPDQPGDTDNLRFLNRLLGKPIPGPKPAYDNRVLTHLIDASNEPDFDRLWQATSQGPLVVSTD